MTPLLLTLALAFTPIHVERDLHYGRSHLQTLDAYLAPDARRAVVLIHGGGFHSGSKESLDPTALRFARNGWSAFSISYRLVPPAPWYAAKQDALATVRWVRARASRFGFDPQRLAVFGTSAGGNLAALVATVGRGRQLVAAAASWSGPMDLAMFAPRNAVIRRYVGCSCAGRLRTLSPVSFVGPGDAPILLANSTSELVPVDQAGEMARRLERAGIPHRLIVYRGSRHAVEYEREAWRPTLSFLSSWTRPHALRSGFRLYSRGPSGGAIWRARIPGARRASLIYVPPGYSAARRYPAIYLLAGMPGSPWAYVKSLSLASVADTLISTRRVPPFVAVMPPAGPSGRYSGEWAGPWEDYLVRRVVPWVQAHLSVSRERTIAGSRRAGSGRSTSRSATRDSSGAWSPGAATSGRSGTGRFASIRPRSLRHTTQRCSCAPRRRCSGAAGSASFSLPAQATAGSRRPRRSASRGSCARFASRTASSWWRGSEQRGSGSWSTASGGPSPRLSSRARPAGASTPPSPDRRGHVRRGSRP